MKRGDVVIAALQGDYGKPRPLVIIQSDLFNSRESITVCPISSHIVDTTLRVTLIPGERNGLKKVSQVMTDKIMTIKKVKVEQQIGSLTHLEIEQLNNTLKDWLDLH